MGARGPFQETPSIRAEALTLARGGRRLFEGLSFAAAPGDYLEVRGANGSGKTSLLRAIAGFLRPLAGRIAFEGAAEPSLALHYLGHRNALKPTASARAHLRYWTGLFGGSSDLSAVLERVGLARAADLPARALSEGMGRRLALGRVLIAPRPVWLLDEPAAGLDADGRALLAELIDAQRADGGVVIAAVHEPLGADVTHTVSLS